MNHVRMDNTVLDKGILAFYFGSVLSAIAMLIGIGVETVQMGQAANPTTYRLSVFGANHNQMAIKLSVALIISVAIYTKNNLRLKYLKPIVLLFSPLIFSALLQTGSRTGLGALMISIFIWISHIILSSKSLLRKLSFMALSLACFSLLVVLIMQSDVMSYRFGQTATGNLGGRQVIWPFFMSMIAEKPIWGYGFSGSEYIVSSFLGRPGETAHNIILQVLIYTGVIGLIFYSLFVYKVLILTYHSYRKYDDLIPMLLLPAIAGYMLLQQALTVKFCWLLLSYIAGNYISQRIKSREPSAQ